MSCITGSYLSCLLHPVQLNRYLRKWWPFVRPVPPTLSHQLISGGKKGITFNSKEQSLCKKQDRLPSLILTLHHHSFWASPSCSPEEASRRVQHRSSHSTEFLLLYIESSTTLRSYISCIIQRNLQACTIIMQLL